jgi:L-threonylcarbamoyladenylate synthase
MRVHTRMLSADSPDALTSALDILRRSGLVAFPTDTVYGLGVLVGDLAGIQRLYRVKGRQSAKAIPVLLSSLDDLPLVAAEINPAVQRLAEYFWPGPLTLVVPRRPDLPAQLSPYPTIGVRIPDHPVALALLRLAGPMAVTSANRSGQPSPSTAQEVRHQLGGRIELILDAGRTPGGVSSTVVDCSGLEPVILRQGPIGLGELRMALGF